MVQISAEPTVLWHTGHGAATTVLVTGGINFVSCYFACNEDKLATSITLFSQVCVNSHYNNKLRNHKTEILLGGAVCPL